MTKETAFVLICLALMLGIVGISVADLTGITKRVDYPKADKDLLIEKGFTNLPYSDIICDGRNNCTYFIVRADKKFYRDLGTTDAKKAGNNLDADIKKFYDDNLIMLKDADNSRETIGVIEVNEK